AIQCKSIAVQRATQENLVLWRFVDKSSVNDNEIAGSSGRSWWANRAGSAGVQPAAIPRKAGKTGAGAGCAPEERMATRTCGQRSAIVGHSLTLLAAALLTGQTVDSNGRTCPCNKAVQGTISAQPEYTSETRWTSWRNSSSSTTTTQTWRSTSEPSRGPLSRIRTLFGRGDNATVRTETIQPSSNGGTVVVQPASHAADVDRR